MSTPSVDTLTAAPSRDAAAAMLSDLTAAQLRECAAICRVSLLSKDTKAEMIRRIVNATVGARLTAEAFRGALR